GLTRIASRPPATVPTPRALLSTPNAPAPCSGTTTLAATGSCGPHASTAYTIHTTMTPQSHVRDRNASHPSARLRHSPVPAGGAGTTPSRSATRHSALVPYATAESTMTAPVDPNPTSA